MEGGAIMVERYIGKCPKCGSEFLYEFVFEEAEDTIQGISIPCPECKHELDWNFLPKLKKYNSVSWHCNDFMELHVEEML